jgi:hypothetical protein
MEQAKKKYVIVRFNSILMGRLVYDMGRLDV